MSMEITYHFSVSKIKILGLVFENYKPAQNFKDNWTVRMECIEKVIKTWSRRD